MTELHPMVAIVDDDPSVLRALKRLLESQLWGVHTYTSAEEFLDHGLEHQVDLAIVDICLPGLSGIELLKRLECEGGGPSVIFMTAHSESETADVLSTAGRTSYLRKPFTLKELMDAVRATWRAPRS
jgi:DNA-binding response OmpR family regulator